MKLKPGRLTAIIKGAVASIGAMALYAISLGCFTALMLLVISMEEGGENLPSSAVPLTQAVILLSQGIGFVAGSIRLGIMPLLLTLLLVALVAQCVRRIGGGPIGWIVGLVVWVALNLMCANGTTIELIDPLPAIIGKTALVWTIGYLLGAVPGSGVIPAVRTAFRERVDRRLYDAVALTLILVAAMFLVAVVTGLVVVAVWIIRDWQGMVTLFEFDGMENGSRILTTIAACAWLPNLMIWGFSWLIGAGFHIGELGAFTLWAGQSAGLPALPVFGLMPEGVSDDRVRIALQCIIPVVYALLALLAMLLPGPMKVRPAAFGDDEGVKRLVVGMLCHLGALAASAALTIAIAAGGFALSNGPLGERRLAHVGVDVVPSIETVARALGFGFATAWLAVTVVLAAIYGIHWIVGHHAGQSPSESTGDGPSAEADRPAASGNADGIGDSTEHGRDDKGTDDAGSTAPGPARGRWFAGNDGGRGNRRARSVRSDKAVARSASSDRGAGVDDAGAAKSVAAEAASETTPERRTARTAEGQAGRERHSGRVVSSERSVRASRPAGSTGSAGSVRSVRSARSTGTSGTPSSPKKLDEQPSKEENDDNNQPSD